MATGSQSATTGQWAEALAYDYLEHHGLSCLERNYHCRHGEIDLVSSDGQTIIFIEVRYRRNDRFGSAAESIDRPKQARILASARHYLQKNPACADKPCRCDAIIISGPRDDYRINWIQGAFSLD